MNPNLSVFSNPSSRSREGAKEYVEAVLGLVGDQDPAAILRTTPGVLEEALMGLTPEQCRRPEAPGKWSAAILLQHLADSELVWGFRLRLILAEPKPTFTTFDQDQWVERLGYAETDPGDAMTLFGTLRRTNLWLLDRVGPGDLDRFGIHPERGEESVRHQILLYAGHDLVHRRQLERICRAVTS